MELDELQLPPIVAKITGQKKVPFGDALVHTTDAILGYETCQELFEMHATHSDMVLQGKYKWIYLTL